MQFQSTLAVLATIVAGTNARIYGIAIPETVKAGDEITAIIASSDYIQSVYDVSIAFGISPAKAAYPDSLGAVLDSFYLGPGMYAPILLSLNLAVYSTNYSREIQ